MAIKPSVLVVAAVLGMILNANANPVDPAPTEVNQAVAEIYGGQIWHDHRLFKYLNTDTGYVFPQFWSKLSESGDRMLVVVSIEPGAIPETNRVPLIGGAILTKNNSRWVVESQNKILGWGGKHDEIGEVKIVRVGKATYGVEISEWDEVRGFESFSKRLFVPINHELKMALEIGAGGPEGDGPCENKVFPAQSLDITYIPSKESDFFDVISSAHYNKGDCEKSVRMETKTRYRLRNGKYWPERR